LEFLRIFLNRGGFDRDFVLALICVEKTAACHSGGGFVLFAQGIMQQCPIDFG
jgi:hypothetical protein